MEVWYPEPLPVSCVTACVLVLPTRPIESSLYGANGSELRDMERELDNLANRLQ